MSWIVTYSGKRFSFDNLDPENVCLEDIAHSLSFTCRYNGMCHRFYSVARHSLNMAKYANACGMSSDVVKQCLLHDASEAYMGDMVSPLKGLMKEFKEYENKLQALIYSKFNLPAKTLKEVKELDQRIMITEKQRLFPEEFPRWEIEDSVQPLEMKLVRMPSISDLGMYVETIVRLDGLHQNYQEVPQVTEEEWLTSAKRLLN